ncbi:MAG: VWA domain-containing protein [Candidatus Dormibacteraeota bacterium]|nr:VWA domain-containing protein [Candidatus Dormibacteraeota bacterium]
MSFLNPVYLPFLLALPVLALLYIVAQRRRSRYAVRFTNLDLLASVVGKRPGIRRHVPTALFLLGLAGIILAASDPVLNLEVARNRASVMLVIDVSGSMEATDVTPSRLDAARSAARSLINQLPPSAEVGLVSFNTKATLQSPLTTNRDAVSQALDSLSPGGGTAIGEGITAALDELARSVASTPEASRPPALIVLLTDGSNNAGIDPQTAAENAKAASVPVQTIGIGAKDKPTFVHGQKVDAVDEPALQAIATTTGGKYYYAQAAGQLSKIYSALGSSFGWQFLRIDILVPVLLVGIFVLLIAGFLSMRWFRLFP